MMKFEKTVRKLLADQGAIIDRVVMKKHLKFFVHHPLTGKSFILTTGKTPSDHRAEQNMKSLIRRNLALQENMNTLEMRIRARQLGLTLAEFTRRYERSLDCSGQALKSAEDKFREVLGQSVGPLTSVSCFFRNDTPRGFAFTLPASMCPEGAEGLKTLWGNTMDLFEAMYRLADENNVLEELWLGVFGACDDIVVDYQDRILQTKVIDTLEDNNQIVLAMGNVWLLERYDKIVTDEFNGMLFTHDGSFVPVPNEDKVMTEMKKMRP